MTFSYGVFSQCSIAAFTYVNDPNTSFTAGLDISRNPVCCVWVARSGQWWPVSASSHGAESQSNLLF